MAEFQSHTPSAMRNHLGRPVYIGNFGIGRRGGKVDLDRDGNKTLRLNSDIFASHLFQIFEEEREQSEDQ